MKLFKFCGAAKKHCTFGSQKYQKRGGFRSPPHPRPRPRRGGDNICASFFSYMVNYRPYSGFWNNEADWQNSVRISFLCRRTEFRNDGDKFIDSFRCHKSEEVEKTKPEQLKITTTDKRSPCEVVWGLGNRNPKTFGSFGYKRTCVSLYPRN